MVIKLGQEFLESGSIKQDRLFFVGNTEKGFFFEKAEVKVLDEDRITLSAHDKLIVEYKEEQINEADISLIETDGEGRFEVPKNVPKIKWQSSVERKG